MIKSAVGHESEDKYLDVVSNTAFSVDYNGIAPFSLSDAAQGVPDTSRIGDTLLAKRLTWAVFVKYNGTSTITDLSLTPNVMRLVIVKWKPFYGDVAPTVSKILTYFGATYAAEAPLSHDGRDQYELISDELITLDGISKACHLFRGSVALNSKVQFKAGSTTNAAGGFYAFLISDAVAGSGVYPSCRHYAFRLDFTDD